MEDQLNYSGSASWLEISAKALKNNVEVFHKIAKGRYSVGLVLKGNAYGHGTELVFPVVHPLTDCIYVITPQDAFTMRQIEADRKLPRKRILVMGPLTSDEVLKCSHLEIEMVLGDLSWIEVLPILRSAGSRSIVHIHLDTGLGREGFNSETVARDLEFLKDFGDVMTIRGVMSHFANTEDVTEQDYATSQVAAFKAGVSALQAELSLGPIEEHLSASAATLVIPAANFSRVRIGISLYGFWPSPETRISSKLILNDLPKLDPVLSWKCMSQIVKKLKKGSFVGYGCTFRCSQDSWIAVFPVGYYDGYPRLVFGKAHVLVRGRRCPVIGRVMMNHIIVDVTNVVSDSTPVEAILIGNDSDEILSAEMLASWADTIQYEIVARLGSHLKRKLVS